jgi:hypothetical protein
MTTDKKININENQVIFKRDNGHKHDGLSSSLIDYTKYSIFDFPVYPVAPVGTPRRSFEDTNVKNLESFIISTVENRVLNPRGIAVQANTITAREIASGTITSGELASNIILVNNVIKSKNYNGTISSDGTITAQGNAGWAITHAGSAEFSSASIRGAIIANSVSTPGIDILSDGSISSTNFNVTASGDLTATNANISGTITATLGSIANWTINSSGLRNAAGLRTVNLYPAIGFASDPVLDINYGGIRTAVSADGLTCWDDTDIDLRLTKDSLFMRNGSIDVDSVSILAGDVQTLLNGKAASSHTHAYASDTHTHAYIPTSGLTSASDISFENTNTGTNALGQVFQLRRRLNSSVGPSGSSFGDNFIQFVRTAGNGWTEAVVSSIEFTSALGVGFNNVSDARMKENIVEISDALNIVNRIRPVNFSWKGYGDRREDGFIAQELYDVYPSSVSVGSDDISERPWGVYYGNFTPLLTAAIKELLAKVNSLEARIQALEGV